MYLDNDLHFFLFCLFCHYISLNHARGLGFSCLFCKNAKSSFKLTSLILNFHMLNRSNIKDGTEKGGSFAAYYHGQLVANVWGGYSDFDCRRPWKEDTLSTFFSSTKAIASAVIAHLVDRFVLLLKFFKNIQKYKYTCI